MLKIAKKEKKHGEEKNYPLLVDDELNVVFLDEYYNNGCSSCPFRGLCGG